MADLLELNPAHVLACVAAERTKSEAARKAWQRAAAATAVVVLALLGADQGMELIATVSDAAAPALYIMSNVALFLATLAGLLLVSHSGHKKHAK